MVSSTASIAAFPSKSNFIPTGRASSARMVPAMITFLNTKTPRMYFKLNETFAKKNLSLNNKFPVKI